MPGCAVDGWQYPVDLPRALGRRWRVAHNSTGSTTTNKLFYGEEDLGNFSAGNMRQREHLDEATVACWVTFCAAAIRLPILIVALQQGVHSAASLRNRNGRAARARYSDRHRP